MADQPIQNLDQLREEREYIRQQIESLEYQGGSIAQQNVTKSASLISGAPYESEDDLSEEIKLREMLAEIDNQIQALESEEAQETERDQPETEVDPPTTEDTENVEDVQQIESLTERYGTKIAIVRTPQPWRLPVNTLVISVGVQGGMQGGLSQAIRNELGESIWQNLRDQVQTAVSTITPKTPVLINLPESLGAQVLPNAPEVPPDSENGRYQIIAATPAQHNSDDLSPDHAAQAIVKLAVDNHLTEIAVPFLGSGRAGLENRQVGEDMLKAMFWSIPDTDHDLTQIYLTTRPVPGDDKSSVVTALKSTVVLLNANRAQKLSADSATGDDTLGIKTEVYALAETLLLRDVETPLAVGILGGWGSGKSFVMHLMQKEMMRIRSLEVETCWEETSQEPYVGHVYPIEFNAWTYAKSDLWASLMQTIFMDLNKQLSLEQLFTPEKLKAGGANWLELNALGEKERLALLQSEVGQDTVAAWRRGETQDSLWQAYHEMRSTETKAMETAVQNRQEMVDQLASVEDSLTIAQKVIPETARLTVWYEILETAVFSPIASQIQNTLAGQQYVTEDGEVHDVFSDEDLKDLTLLAIKLKQFRPTMSGMWQIENLKKSVQENIWVIVTAVLLILASIAAALVSDLVEKIAQSATVASFTSFLAAASSIVLAAFRTYQKWADEIQRWTGGIEDVQTLAQDLLDTKEAEISTKAEEEVNKQKEMISKKISEIDAQIDKHRQRMGIAGQYTSLFDFVSSRLAVGDYEERLGTLHRTQADLQELTDTLTLHGPQDIYAEAKQKFFPRGPARVVLFIDDLDRCPPPKVVEVLEAVQLLLRTKLFVVVLGLDTRYVTRALEKEYVGILTRMGDPSGLDYIEKIIQIPYRVRPIEPENLHTFLSAQMEMVIASTDKQEKTGGGSETAVTPKDGNGVVSGETPGEPDDDGKTDQRPTEKTPKDTADDTPPDSADQPERLSPQVIKFHHEDFADLENACVSLGLTPRSIKRLINVLKLIKVFWFRTNQNKKQYEIRMVINLLTLSARYPEIMAQAFLNIELAFRESEKREGVLGDYLKENLDMGGLISHTQQNSFKTAVDTLKFEEMTLAQFGLETFHLVRSFSFVGDPSYDD